MGFLQRRKDGGLPRTTEGLTERFEGMLAQQQQIGDYRTRISRVMSVGVDTLAEVKTVQLAGSGPMLHGQFVWIVKPAREAPYELASDAGVRADLAGSLSPGAPCTLKVDPADPQSVLLVDYGPDWTPPAPPPPAGAADDRIAKLEALHAQGLITDDELAARKREILGAS
jgi:putative oligomerization/nucleic acid binding protein